MRPPPLHLAPSQHAAGILAAFRAGGYPGQVTGIGSMFQVHLHTRPITDYRSAYLSPQERAAMLRLQQEMLTRGVIICNKGFGFLSTVNTESDIDALTEALEGSLRALPGAHEA